MKFCFTPLCGKCIKKFEYWGIDLNSMMTEFRKVCRRLSKNVRCMKSCCCNVYGFGVCMDVPSYQSIHRSIAKIYRYNIGISVKPVTGIRRALLKHISPLKYANLYCKRTVMEGGGHFNEQNLFDRAITKKKNIYISTARQYFFHFHNLNYNTCSYQAIS